MYRYLALVASIALLLTIACGGTEIVTKEVVVEKEVIKEVPVEVIIEKESSGACNRASSVSPMTGAINSLMLFGPLLLAGGYRQYRRSKK